jgi:hypothetical protein
MPVRVDVPGMGSVVRTSLVKTGLEMSSPPATTGMTSNAIGQCPREALISLFIRKLL